MSSGLLVTALGLMLVFEGLMPLIAPAQWRAMFLQIAGLRDGQIRFIGLGAALLGLVLIVI
jgi:uncharacterized protein YjeT (DUF2065 family)